MSRATRSFKLRLSPEGMDLLIEAHCHLIRSTRSLIAWGATLHVAVVHLGDVPSTQLGRPLAHIREGRYFGDEEHHVGAPRELVRLASTIAEDLGSSCQDNPPPSLGMIYLLALHQMRSADGCTLLATYQRVKATTRTATQE